MAHDCVRFVSARLRGEPITAPSLSLFRIPTKFVVPNGTLYQAHRLPKTVARCGRAQRKRQYHPKIGQILPFILFALPRYVRRSKASIRSAARVTASAYGRTSRSIAAKGISK